MPSGKCFPRPLTSSGPGPSRKTHGCRPSHGSARNTPTDSLFALDPHYVDSPGEDYHGFRALAERSVLADYEKDAGMAARVPRLAPRWLKEVTAQSGWQNFQPTDFQRLKNDFGVSWVIISRSQAQGRATPVGMTCPYQNRQLQVCRLY